VTDALSGVRVVDMATVVAGPGTAKYIADFGADVIKVEAPSGDPARRLGWTAAGDQDSLFWKILGRGKRCITLDLKDPADHRRMRRLLDSADLLIENMRPGKLEALDLAPQSLLATNPKLVILRVTGFGQDGPYAMRPGFATLAEAMSGLSALSGEPDGGPLLPPIALTDEVTALAGAFAALVALRHAERTGEGQVVDVNLLESMFQLMGPLPAAYADSGYLQPRLGSGIPYTVPRGTYRCADGVWVAISSSAETVAQRLLELLGIEEDQRFRTFQDRSRNREALESKMAAYVAARTSAEVLAEFERVDAAIAPVLDMKDIVEDPHYHHRRALVEVDGVLMQNVVARLSRTPGRIRHAGRPLGADNDAVLGELDAESTSRGGDRRQQDSQIR
jgi:crotonobetainyl-CoA:carnitine CoA-transferase CaiB-like acyl-CoA transferase